MKLSKFFAFAASTVGVNGDCIDSWTHYAGHINLSGIEIAPPSCTPPTAMTDSFTCGSSELSLTISPSHVYDDYTFIPTTTLATLKVQIQDSNGAWTDLVTFGTDDTAQTQTVAYNTIAPIVSSDDDFVYFSYTLKVDSPSITQNGHTFFTTRHADNFNVKCKMSRSFDVSSDSTTITAPQLDDAVDSEVTIDAPSLFTLKTYPDDSYVTEQTSFELGSTVYSRLAADMADMPTGIQWDVNDCTAEADGSTETIPVFQSSGTCTNPLLNAIMQPLTSTGLNFAFRAFTYADNTADDQIILKCSIKIGTDSDTVANTDACVAPMA